MSGVPGSQIGSRQMGASELLSRVLIIVRGRGFIEYIMLFHVVLPIHLGVPRKQIPAHAFRAATQFGQSIGKRPGVL